MSLSSCSFRCRFTAAFCVLLPDTEHASILPLLAGSQRSLVAADHGESSPVLKAVAPEPQPHSNRHHDTILPNDRPAPFSEMLAVPSALAHQYHFARQNASRQHSGCLQGTFGSGELHLEPHAGIPGNFERAAVSLRADGVVMQPAGSSADAHLLLQQQQQPQRTFEGHAQATQGEQYSLGAGDFVPLHGTHAPRQHLAAATQAACVSRMQQHRSVSQDPNTAVTAQPAPEPGSACRHQHSPAAQPAPARGSQAAATQQPAANAVADHTAAVMPKAPAAPAHSKKKRQMPPTKPVDKSKQAKSKADGTKARAKARTPAAQASKAATGAAAANARPASKPADGQQTGAAQASHAARSPGLPPLLPQAGSPATHAKRTASVQLPPTPKSATAASPIPKQSPAQQPSSNGVAAVTRTDDQRKASYKPPDRDVKIDSQPSQDPAQIGTTERPRPQPRPPSKHALAAAAAARATACETVTAALARCHLQALGLPPSELDVVLLHAPVLEKDKLGLSASTWSCMPADVRTAFRTLPAVSRVRKSSDAATASAACISTAVQLQRCELLLTCGSVRCCLGCHKVLMLTVVQSHIGAWLNTLSTCAYSPADLKTIFASVRLAAAILDGSLSGRDLLNATLPFPKIDTSIAGS